MTTINSAACEQAFNWINAFKNIKSMNEAHFKFFLLYIIDLHNLHMEGKVGLNANPMNSERDIESVLKNVECMAIEPKKISNK